MARLDWIEHRLRNWARWKLMSGSGVLGFAGVNLENAEMPREPYADAPVPTDEIEASKTDGLVRRLPPETQRTIEAWYIDNGGLAKKLSKLGCSESTLHRRIEQGHHLLARLISDDELTKAEYKRREQERVRSVMAGARR